MKDSTSLRTLKDWARYAGSYFNKAVREKKIFLGHGTQNPIDEAVWLVMAAVHLEPERFEWFADCAVTKSEAEKIADLIEKRLQLGKPLAYLLGEAWLQNERFICDERALVPRSLIAELLDQALDPFLIQEPESILDMCTGGGSLAILSALRFPSAKVAAADFDPKALALANENVQLHGLQERISCLETDLFDKISDKFDLIVCNPPYVNQSSMQRLPKEYLAEPHHALAGGEDGMLLIRKIMAQAKTRLTANGILVLELGNEAPYFDVAFPSTEVTWLPTAGGERSVFVVDRKAL